MKLSIIIVSYNVRELLLNSITSLYAERNQLQLEVIVVDNNSNDNSVMMVREHFPEVKIIENKTNSGFSAANNQGMEQCTGDLILLLNPDTEIKKDALEKMVNYGRSQKELFLIGPRLNNSDGSLQISAWKKQGLWNVIAETFFLHRALGLSTYPAEQFNHIFFPEMISGAAMLFPKNLFLKIGGLDPQLFWMEDADFCRRAKEAGAVVIYYPGAEIIHHSGQSSKKEAGIVISNQLLSKLKYIKKHSSVFAWLLASFFCFLHIVSRLTVFGFLCIFSQGLYGKARGYTFAMKRYFNYLFTGEKRVT